VVFFNYTTMQMTAKIVYYGPGLCGKTTNLHHIHHKTAPKSRGEMISLETETDRTLFFDLLPIEVGVIGGMKIRLQLYTVPGQVFYNATRKLVLKGVDGIVFVADSQVAAAEGNLESLRNLEVNMSELGVTLDQIPVVFQYNKRDIRSILPVETMAQTLNPWKYPHFEAAALHGVGVFETLKGISRLALSSVRQKILAEDPRRRRTVSIGPAAPTPPTPAPAAPPPAPLASLVTDTPAAEDMAVEFAEEVTGKHELRVVETKDQLDILRELESLRTATAAPLASRPAPSTAAREVERRLQDLVSDRDSKQEIKRKASVEIPVSVLRATSDLKVHLSFEGSGELSDLRDVITVKLVGNRRLQRLSLLLDLDLKGKG